MPNKNKKPIGFTIGAASCALLVAVGTVAWCITGSYTKIINQAFHLKSTKTIMTEAEKAKGVLFESDYEDVSDLKKDDMKVAEELTEEGAVLLKNTDKALPLAKKSKVTILGHQSTNMLVCGTGSADISAVLDKEKYHSSLDDADGYLTIKAALEERTDIEVNPTVWNTYMKWTEDETYTTNPKKGDNGIRTGNGGVSGQYTINEVGWDTLTQQSGVTESMNEYSDAAIVVVSRLGGEMMDLPSSPSSKGNASETENGSGNSLELTVQEKELITNAKSKFKKVIVIINSANALECDFLTASDSKVDAALWVGYTGLVGLYGVADLLAGNSNPSGRLVDTYCNDNTTNPAMANFYGNVWTNAVDLGAKYNAETGKYTSGGLMTGTNGGDLDGNMCFNAYQEGIYVGYRYYETRYEDTVMGTGNAGTYNYLSDVAYPFGYGLSYTSFSYSKPTFTDNGDNIDVKLTVTNTGDVAGKDTVELYFQSEYTDFDKTNNIEKSAIELCGFTKTDVIEPSKTQDVTINVKKEVFKTYFEGANDGEGQYIMDAGNYYLSVGTDAHDALNNVLAKKGKTGMVKAGDRASSTGNADNVYSWNISAVDYTTYLKSSVTKAEIHNQCQSANLSYYGGTDMPFVTRSNWKDSMPTKHYEITLTDNMQKEMTGMKVYEAEDCTGETMPLLSQAGSLKVSDMTGKDYDDANWDKLISQMSYKDLCNLVGIGYHGTVGIESISKPETVDENGPQGFSANLTDLTGNNTSLCAYTDENIMAATWNTVLMEEVGKHIGEDGIWGGYSGLYGPAMNTHRTAYAGRNFEYYSEDGFLAGKIAASEVKGIQSKGVYVFIKHFALNDCENGCRSISTFVNEQAIREVYLQPFEYAVTEGGAYNVMNAFARVGVIWSGAHKGLMTNILRGEWGCRGFAISDYTNTSYQTSVANTFGTYDAKLGVLAGTDTFDSSAATAQMTQLLNADYEHDIHLVKRMVEAAHRICYVVANSNAMQGNGKIVSVMNWWQFVIIDVIIWSSVATIVLGVLATVKWVKYNKHKDE